MKEEVPNEIQELLSHFHIVEAKIDELQLAMNRDRSHFATKDDLKLFATKDDLRLFATKDDLRSLATKDDLKVLGEKIDLKFAARADLAQTKFDLVIWMFTFWFSVTIMLLGLYFKR